MANAKLLLKLGNFYVVQDYGAKIDYITVPNYNYCSSNEESIYLFLMLLCNGNLDKHNNAILPVDSKKRDAFLTFLKKQPLIKIEDNTYFYDLFAPLNAMDLVSKKEFQAGVNRSPGDLMCCDYYELQNRLSNQNLLVHQLLDNSPIIYRDTHSLLTSEVVEKYCTKPKETVLLLYSGGRDSMLSAVRLHNEGYNVCFIHFDNGEMIDADWPFIYGSHNFNREYERKIYPNGNLDDIIIKKIYPDNSKAEEYGFPIIFQCVDIKDTFKKLCDACGFAPDEYLEHGTLFSELRCLCCRTAMYIETIKLARTYGYKYIAEGARESQLFMVEQEEILTEYKKLMKLQGIELLLPVIKETDDQKIINELLAAGLSGKPGEAKCKLGRAAMEKSKFMKGLILEVFEHAIKPVFLQSVDVRYYTLQK